MIFSNILYVYIYILFFLPLFALYNHKHDTIRLIETYHNNFLEKKKKISSIPLHLFISLRRNLNRSHLSILSSLLHLLYYLHILFYSLLSFFFTEVTKKDLHMLYLFLAMYITNICDITSM